MTTTLHQARELDEHDELARFRDRFVPIGDPGVVAYLDGNSLGRPLLATADRVGEVVRDAWGTRLIRAWSDGWLDLPQRIGDKLGQAALGAAPDQVIVADSTSVCLYKALRAAVALRPGRTEIVADRSDFPTDRFIVAGVAGELGMTVNWLESGPWAGVTFDEVATAVGARTAVVLLSHVDYRSAAIADMRAITELVHAAGALVVWDLCHSVGVLPVELDDVRVDLAVGCTYKFLNAGPGAPAFLYVNSAQLADFRQPVPGWMGAADIFAMAPEYRPADGIRRVLSGTPSILGMIGVDEGVGLVAEAGIDRIRAKADALGELAIELADAWLLPKGFTLASPRQAHLRGGHVTVRRPDAKHLADTLIAHGVIVDFRTPDGIRLGLSPLTTGFAELWLAMDRIRDLSGSAGHA